MVNIEHFQLPREQLEARLKWYENQYGAYIGNRGVHNYKNLLKKPNFYDWTILFMLIMALFISWAYNRDISVCREFIKEQETWFDNYSYGDTTNMTYPNMTYEVLKGGALPSDVGIESET